MVLLLLYKHHVTILFPLLPLQIHNLPKSFFAGNRNSRIHLFGPLFSAGTQFRYSVEAVQSV